ncbi:hypothetical protein ACWF0M_34740 [Kribbella sp. NPDC055110]
MYLDTKTGQGAQDLAATTVVLVLHVQAALAGLAEFAEFAASCGHVAGRDHGGGQQVAVADRLVDEGVGGHGELL